MARRPGSASKESGGGRRRREEERIGKRRVVGLVKWRLVGGAGMSGRLVRGREGCWGGSSEIEFTPSEVRQFVSDHGARKMLPVVYGTGGPPSSRWRRRATIFLGSGSGNTRNIANSSWIIKPISTATVMTTALGLLMVLLPAAYPEKISIGECGSNSVLSLIEFREIREMAMKATKEERTSGCKERFATNVLTVMEGCCTRLDLYVSIQRWMEVNTLCSWCTVATVRVKASAHDSLWRCERGEYGRDRRSCK